MTLPVRGIYPLVHTFFYCTHFPTLQKNLDIFNTSKNFGHFQHFKKIWTFSTLQKNLGISRTCKIFEDFRHNFSKSFGFLSHHEIFILQNLFTLETVKPRKLLPDTSKKFGHFQHFKKFWTFSTLQKNLVIFNTSKKFEHFMKQTPHKTHHEMMSS